MKKICLSLFDGISGLQLSLKRAGIKIDKYYASEVDEPAITITQSNFPNTIQLGDVRKIKKGTIKEKVWLLSAGSPCQDLSHSGAQFGMRTLHQYEQVTCLKDYLKFKKKGRTFIGESYLFWEFVRLIKELKPKYFFFENVNMTNEWKYIISRELRAIPIRVNSSLVTAQNRDRYYWTNIPNVKVPMDKGVLLKDVIPNAVAGFGIRGRKNEKTGKYEPFATLRKDGKANCLVTSKGNTAKIELENGDVRRLTIDEAEMLQTLPKGYTNIKGITDTQRWRGVGNGWTIDVVSQLLSPLKKDLAVAKK